MFIPDPDFFPSRIPDPKTATKEGGGGGEIVFYHFFSHKSWDNLQRILEFFTPKIAIKVSKYEFGIRDPGSGRNLFRIPDLGGHKSP
jgi:hypothetical protein